MTEVLEIQLGERITLITRSAIIVCSVSSVRLRSEGCCEGRGGREGRGCCEEEAEAGCYEEEAGGEEEESIATLHLTTWDSVRRSG